MKLDTVLDSLVKFVDPRNYDKIMNEMDTKVTENYFDLLNLFVNKFGQINPDDYGKFKVLKNLAALHPKDEIVKGIASVF